MSVRAIDANGDWIFGKGINDYLSGNAAVQQSIKTRLLSFLGNCFFDVTAGIDWFNLLGAKNQTQLTLAISSTILNTDNVTGLLQLSVTLNPISRAFSITYQVQTTYSTTGDTFQYDLGGTYVTPG